MKGNGQERGKGQEEEKGQEGAKKGNKGSRKGIKGKAHLIRPIRLTSTSSHDERSTSSHFGYSHHPCLANQSSGEALRRDSRRWLMMIDDDSQKERKKMIQRCLVILIDSAYRLPPTTDHWPLPTYRATSHSPLTTRATLPEPMYPWSLISIPYSHPCFSAILLETVNTPYW